MEKKPRRVLGGVGEAAPSPPQALQKGRSLHEAWGAARAAGARPGALPRGASPFPLPGPFSVLQPPTPSSLASSPESPSTPSEVEAAWVEQGGRGQGSGQAHCLETKELTSAPGAGPPTPPGLPAPQAARVDFVHLIWGLRSRSAYASLQSTASGWRVPLQSLSVTQTYSLSVRESTNQVSIRSSIQLSTYLSRCPPTPHPPT